MPIVVTEKFASRTKVLGPNSSVELEYDITGSDDDAAVMAAVNAAAPATFDLIPKDSIQIEPVGPQLWTATVTYTTAPQTGESTFQFETGGGTSHITQSLATIANYAPSGVTPPDHKGAIGVTGETVNGVDIVIPVYNFNEVHYLADSAVDAAYKSILFSLTGKVNDASFKGFAAKEVLFLGASGSKRSAGDWELNYRFAASKTVTGLTIGDITGVNKTGWEYLWVEYANDTDASSGRFIRPPIAAHVEKVYDEGDFSLLNIGV